MVVIGILGVLVGILAVAVIPKLVGAKKDLEVKQIADIMNDVKMIQATPTKKKRMTKQAVKDSSGYRFFSIALHREILSAEILGKLVSLNSKNDTKADSSFFDDDEAELDPTNVSYTAPKGKDLLSMLGAKGKKRKVILCFNERNWQNAEDEVLIQWSDGEVAVYLKHIDLDDQYDSISKEDWENGTGIIGEKEPFDKTFIGDEG
jgi:hypothetical protein